MRWRIHHTIRGEPGIHTTDANGFESIEELREWFGRFPHLAYVRAENLDLPVTVTPVYGEMEHRALGAAAEIGARAWRR